MSLGMFCGQVSSRSCSRSRVPYLSRNEDRERSCQSEDTGWFHRCDNCINLATTIVSRGPKKPDSRPSPRTYRLATERLPDNCTVLDGVLRMPAGRNHPPLTNIDHVHDADHKVVTGASALFFLVESGDQILAHVGPKIGRVQRDDLGLFFEEEHRGDGDGSSSMRWRSSRAAPTRRDGTCVRVSSSSGVCWRYSGDRVEGSCLLHGGLEEWTSYEVRSRVEEVDCEVMAWGRAGSVASRSE